MIGAIAMKLNTEQMKQYYATRGIDRGDLVSEEAIHLTELPADACLDDIARSIVEHTVGSWNRLDPLSRIVAAQAIEGRLLKRRRPTIFDIHIPAEAWCAYLFLGRLRGCEARREVMAKIARGEMTPADARRARNKHKVCSPRTRGAATV